MSLDRLALALALILLGYLTYRAYGWAVLRRRARHGLGIDEYRPGRPAILYFTDPGCAPCLSVQDPALQEVAAQFGEGLQIIKVRALERPELTDAWGVLSLPTTFIIDSGGRPRGVNHGVARAPHLLDQLAAIGELGAAHPASPTPAASD
ncbi:MAG TPA: thioredoxin family protein [Anaerolineales bacterium]|nr:thioredoxin family protein [Anaerolineales bacterium]